MCCTHHQTYFPSALKASSSQLYLAIISHLQLILTYSLQSTLTVGELIHNYAKPYLSLQTVFFGSNAKSRNFTLK